MVVSLPGLDVSPGDLFVSNGVADILNGTNCYGENHISLWLYGHVVYSRQSLSVP